MFAHFLAVLVENEIVYKYVLIRRFALYEGRYCHKRVEPSSCLVYSFAYEIGREKLFIEILLVFKRIMLLGKRHSSAVKPAVHYFRYPGHSLTAYRTCEMNIIHIRSVQLYILCDIFLGFFRKLSSASHTFKVSAFASPDRYRRTPVSVS